LSTPNAWQETRQRPDGYDGTLPAGKIADIPLELSKNNPQVAFMMKLVPGAGSTELEFVNLKTRTYPGMRADFRVVAPVSDTEGEFECEDAQYGLDCPEQLPF
jgi:hypothetical protein